MCKQYVTVYRRGFTLVEVIVAMSIISILIALTWNNFFSSMNRSTDSRRKKDLATVAQALEMYYADMNRYPADMSSIWGNTFSNPTITPIVMYLQKTPEDPKGIDYCYVTDANGTYFRLYAMLDNTQDSQRINPPVSCGGRNYNYGISSANTTP